MSTTTTNEADAIASMKSRAADLANLYRIADNAEHIDLEDRTILADIVGCGVADVGDTADEVEETVRDFINESMLLSLELDNEAAEVRAIFETGGPHNEMRFTVLETPGRGAVAAGIWWLSLPWFGRVEIRDGLPTALVRFANELADTIDQCGGMTAMDGYDEELWNLENIDDDED